MRQSQKLTLSNPSPDRDACYKIMTTRVTRYAALPAQGLIPAGATAEVEIVLITMDELPGQSDLRDRFLIQAAWKDASPMEDVLSFWKYSPPRRDELFQKKFSSELFQRKVSSELNDGATPLHIAADKGHGEIVSGLVVAGVEVNTTAGDGTTPLYIAAQNGHSDAVLALLIGGSRPISIWQLSPLNRPDWRHPYPDVHALLLTPPPAASLIAAQLRLAWSGLLHERLGSDCFLFEIVSIDVAACIGHFLEVAVYRARLRQAQLIHEFRTSTSVDSDDVARVCLVDADWDVTVATGRFLATPKVPAQGACAR